MSTEALVFPFAVAEGLQLAVPRFAEGTGTLLTNVRVQKVEDVGQHRIDIIDAKPSWDRLVIDCSIEFTEEQASEILPEPKSWAKEATAAVTIYCASTKYRRSVRLETSANGWAGQVSFSRTDVHGSVELIPFIVRSMDRKPVDGFGCFAGAILGRGPSVQVIADKTARRFDGSIEWRWEKFADSESPWRAARKDDLFHLEPGEVPVMYLNLRWESLKQTLEHEGRTGPAAAMRDMTAAVIGQAGWTQLLSTALASIKEEEGEYFVVSDAWRQDLVRLVLDEVYPDVPASDRLKMAYEDWNKADAVGELISKIGAIAQSRSRVGKFFHNAIEQTDAAADFEPDES